MLSMKIMTTLNRNIWVRALVTLDRCVVVMCSKLPKIKLQSNVPEILAQLFSKSGKLRAAERHTGQKVVSAK